MARLHPQHPAPRQARPVCHACRSHAPDDSGLCPLCLSVEPGDLVTDLRAQHGATARLRDEDRGVVA